MITFIVNHFIHLRWAVIIIMNDEDNLESYILLGQNNKVFLSFLL